MRKKKILVSLLVSPLALSAFGITVEQEGLVKSDSWTQNGVTGGYEINDGGIIYVQPGTVSLNQTITISKAGVYKISLENAENAQLSIDGQTINSDNVYTVKVGTDEVRLTLKVDYKEASKPYTFSGVKVVFDFDFTKYYNQYTTTLNGLSLEAVPEGDNSTTAANLRKEREGLVAKIATVEGQVAEINPGTVDAYASGKYKFYNEKNDLAIEVENLKSAVDAYNAKVQAETKAYETITANTDAKAQLLAGVETLQSNLEAAKAVIKGYSDTKQEYVNGKVNETINAIQSAIDAYKAAIETAYADLTKEDITAPASQVEAINKQIDELNGAIDKASTAYDKYQAYTKAYNDLRNAFFGTSNILDGLQGVEGYEDVYNDYVSEKQDAASALFNDINTIADADATATINDWDEYMASITEATEKITAIGTDASALAEDQNSKFTDAMNAVNEIVVPSLPASDEGAKACKSYKEAVDNLIADLKKKIVTDYEAHEVKDSYTTDLDAINAAIGKYNTELSKWTSFDEAVKALQTNADALDAAIAKLEETLEGYNLRDKFEDNITNLKAAAETIDTQIKALTTENYPGLQSGIEKQIEDVNKAIKEAQENAKTIYDAIVAVDKDLKVFDDLISKVNGYVDSKPYVNGVAKPKPTDVTTDLTAKYNEFDNEFTQAKAAEAQACYTQCVKLKAKIDEYGYNAQVAMVLKDFESEYTQKNINAAKSVIANAKAAMGEGYVGYDENAYKNLEDKLYGYQSDLGNAEEAAAAVSDAYVKKFTTIDNNVIKLISDVNAKKADIDKRIADQKAYDALENQLTDLKNKIDDLSDDNKKTALEPAQAHYTEIINGYYTTLEAIQSDLDKYHDAITVATNENAIVTRINELSGSVDQTRTDIYANETAHNAQLVVSNSVRKIINDAIDFINETVGENKLGSDEQAQVTEWIESLVALRDKDLIKVDRDSYNAFAGGQSSAQHATIMDEYDVISKNARKIQNTFDEAFGGLVSNTNDATLNSIIKWDDLIKDLNTEYTDAINAYNQYYGLTNTEFKAAMIAVVGNHATIFDYIKKISELNVRAKDWVTEKNTNKQTFTVDQFEDAFVNVGGTEDPTQGDLLAGMKADVQKMQEDALAEATRYYNAEYATAKETYDNAINKLTGTGLFTDAEAKAALETATKLLKKGDITPLSTNWEEALETAKAVDKALSSLQAIPRSIDLQTAVLGKWKENYNNAKAINDLLANLEKLPYGDKTEAKTKIEGCLTEAQDINGWITNNSNPVDILNVCVTIYNNLVKQAQAAYDQAKANSDNAGKDKALDEEYSGYLDDFNSQLENLEAYVKGFAADNTSVIKSVKAQIDDFKQFIEDNKSHLSAVEGTLSNKKEALDAEFAGAYGKVVNNEQYKINHFINDVKVSYNNAKTNNSTLTAEELGEIYTQIEDAITEANTIFNKWAESKDNDAYKAAAIVLEKTLSEIYVTLESSYDNGDVAGSDLDLEVIKSELENQYNEIASTITALNEYLAECDNDVKDQFQGIVDGYATELGKVKTEWTNEGDRLLLTYGNYEDAMNDINTQVAGTKSEIEKAQAEAEAEAARVEANNTAYKNLNAQIGQYTDTYNDLVAKASEYGVDNYNGDLLTVKQLIDQAKESIDEAKKAVALTEESEVPNAATIESKLASLTYNISKAYAYNMLADAQATLNSTNAALTGNIVLSYLTAMKAEMSNYDAEYNNVSGIYKDAVTTFLATDQSQADADNAAGTFTQVAETAKQLKQAIEELAASIDQYRFTPGDVNGQPDGKVTIADVQMIINWVGDPASQDDMTPVQFAAADFNGDETLDISDVTSVINLMLNQNAQPNQMRLMSRRAMRQSESVMSIASVGSADGVTTYAINLSNTEALVAGQFDIKLDGDIEIVGITTGDRASEHDIFQFDNAEGARVIIASMDNAAIADNDGAVVYLQVTGSGDISIDNAIFAEGTGAAVEVKTDANTSLIESIYEGMREVKEKVYNVAGQALRSLQRGFNIVRKSDGTTTKELHK